METTSFIINNKTYDISIKGSPPFLSGADVVLSNEQADIAFHQPWYQDGYTAVQFLDNDEFSSLKDGLTNCVKKIIVDELGINVDNFSLDNYHHFITSSEQHYKVVSKTRDLFPEDFNFPLTTIIPKFEKILGFSLSDISPFDGSQLHIIVRINRPFSTDFNPPHKDIYEGVDDANHIPQFINLWIPICGVTDKSSLPVVKSSHLLKESELSRTFEGAVVEGNKYRVRMIKSWNGDITLTRPEIKYGEVLFFTSHLVHGLAINEEEDSTRVALEFRLFKK